MASIVERKRKDGSASYVAQIIKRDKGTTLHQESRTFPTCKQAASWAKKREAEIAEVIAEGGNLVKQSDEGKTLADAITAYLNDNKKPIWKTKRQVLNTINAEYDLVKMRCDKIMSKHIIDFAKQLHNRPRIESASTVLNHLPHLLAIFEAGKMLGYPLSHSEITEAMLVCSKMGFAAKSMKRDRRPSVAEVNALMQFFADKKTLSAIKPHASRYRVCPFQK